MGLQDAPISDPQSIEDLSIYSGFNSLFLLVSPPPTHDSILDSPLFQLEDHLFQSLASHVVLKEVLVF